MSTLLRYLGFSVVFVVAVFAVGLGVGLMVTYWSTVANVALIVLGLGAIAFLTMGRN